jgi:gamma-glutamylcyclotransferase (GGCT)/AIG2-like uncharacterized protein YtfP
LERMNIFTYGSLMFTEVSSKVMNGSYKTVEARLYGYTRKRVKDETYPAAFPAAAAEHVDGKIYIEVDAEDVAALDRFEGEYYRREPAECVLPHGDKIFAYVYVFREEYMNLIGGEDWDPEWFSRIGMNSFLSGYKGFQGA